MPDEQREEATRSASRRAAALAVSAALLLASYAGLYILCVEPIYSAPLREVGSSKDLGIYHLPQPLPRYHTIGLVPHRWATRFFYPANMVDRRFFPGRWTPRIPAALSGPRSGHRHATTTGKP